MTIISRQERGSASGNLSLQNKYSPADDDKLGLEAAAQAEQQLPIMRDDLITSYVNDLGRRLVASFRPRYSIPSSC